MCRCNSYSSSVKADVQARGEKEKQQKNKQQQQQQQNDFVDYMLKRRSVIKKNIISNVFASLVSGHILQKFR